MVKCPECGKWYIGKMYVNDCIKAHERERRKKKIVDSIKPSSFKERLIWAGGVLIIGALFIGLLFLFIGDNSLLEVLASITGLFAGFILFDAKLIGKIKRFFGIGHKKK